MTQSYKAVHEINGFAALYRHVHAVSATVSACSPFTSHPSTKLVDKVHRSVTPRSKGFDGDWYEVVVLKHVGILRCLVDCRLFCSCPRRDECSVQMRQGQTIGDRDVPSNTSAVRPLF